MTSYNINIGTHCFANDAGLAMQLLLFPEADKQPDVEQNEQS